MSSKLNFYPSLKAQMGIWDYYITRMRIRDVAREVSFASEFMTQENQVDVLGNARQRALSRSRVREQIVSYLEREHRFFSSLVVATVEGKPKFFPVNISTDDASGIFADSDIDESFGILRLDESRRIYALDGQHRLAAIKSIIDKGYRKGMGLPEENNVSDSFGDEELSVIMIIPKSNDKDKNFLRNYRRLFASLNRHAKTTSRETNIIIDEDDVYAILTRQLINEHDLFQDPSNKEGESQRVKMGARNLAEKDPHFTSLQTLYDANKILLLTRERVKPWKKKDKDSRPTEENLECFYKELSDYWSAIADGLPDLRKLPLEMRPSSKGNNHMLFRPVGQIVLATVVRSILDAKFPNGRGKRSEMKKHIASSLGSINWNLLSYPWYGIVVTPGKNNEEYTLREDKRKEVIKWASHFVQTLAGIGPMSQDRLFEEWKALVSPKQDKEYWDKNIAPLFKSAKK